MEINLTGKAIHQQAERAREDGDFVEALKLTDQAMLTYHKEGDKLGFAEIQSSRFLTFRHLYAKTDDKAYLILAESAVMNSVRLAEASGMEEALAMPVFNLAKFHETMGEFNEAVINYKLALDNLINHPPSMHNRPSIVADFEIHLAVCEYKAGDKSALQKAEEALAKLETTDEVSKYNKDVWVSGGHMRIAEMLREDYPKQAKEHLQKAKEIIDSNPDLMLRLGQWDKLAQTLNL